MVDITRENVKANGRSRVLVRYEPKYKSNILHKIKQRGSVVKAEFWFGMGQNLKKKINK